MSSTGTGGRAPAGSGIVPGGHAPGTAPVLLDEAVAFWDWFGHPNNCAFDGVSLLELPINLNNCNPTTAMTTLISLKLTVPLAFLGLFPSAGAPHGLTHLLLFHCSCLRVLGTPSLFNNGLQAHSDEVAGGSSLTVGFPNTAFNPHDATT